MADASRPDITVLLQQLRASPQSADAAREELIAAVYQELHQIASRLMRSERSDHTLQPTALVHEAYLRLVDQTRIEWQDRSHFFAIAARLMRRILVDRARGHACDKRGAGWDRITHERGIPIALLHRFEIGWPTLRAITGALSRPLCPLPPRQPAPRAMPQPTLRRAERRHIVGAGATHRGDPWLPMPTTSSVSPG